MSKHDEIRRILPEAGFKFRDSERTALDMTDEEVDIWLSEFVVRMTELGRTMTAAFQKLTIAMVQAVEPLRELDSLLGEVSDEDHD